MAAAATALASAAEIPDSLVERNWQLFRAGPPGVERSRKRIIRPAVVKSEADTDGKAEKQEPEEKHWAACMTAMLINTDPGVGYIDAPIGVQPPSYYRDLANHPNILATIVYTARRRAGLLPSVMGQQLSQEEWKDYTSKFNAWLNEIDAFWYYVTLADQRVETITSNSNSVGDAVVKALSKFVVKSSDEAAEVEADVTERITKTVGLAMEYLVEKNITQGPPAQAVTAGLQHEAFGSPGASNPSLPISFTTTTLSETSSSNTIQQSSATMNQFTFRLNSTNVIASAEALSQGTTLVSTKAYCDYINGPLDNWAENRPSPA